MSIEYVFSSRRGIASGAVCMLKDRVAMNGAQCNEGNVMHTLCRCSHQYIAEGTREPKLELKLAECGMRRERKSRFNGRRDV